MPRSKKINFLGYFSNWGSLSNNNKTFGAIRGPEDILSRLENIENVPRKSLWYRHVHLLLLYSNNLDWSIGTLCKLFSILKRLNLQFPELILRHYPLLSTSTLDVSQSSLVIDSLLYNSLKADNLINKIIKDLEKAEYDWKFDELSTICYFIYKLKCTTNLFNKLKKISHDPIFNILNIEKQLEICLYLSINFDKSKLISQIDLNKCSCASLILLIRLGYFDINILKKRIYQFNCSNLAGLAYHMHSKFPDDFTKIAPLLISRLSYIYHKLTLFDSFLLLYTLRRSGITSKLMESFLIERIGYFKIFEPPTHENYSFWLYLYKSLPSNSFPLLPNFYL